MLKNRYQYLNFAKVPTRTATAVFSCLNNKSGEELGQVRWYSSWRQYCYFPSIRAVYSAGCLTDIADFVKQINDAHNQKLPLLTEQQEE